VVEDFDFRWIKPAIALVGYLVDVVPNPPKFEIGVCIHFCFWHRATPQQSPDGVRPGHVVGFCKAIERLKILIVDSDLKA
jgi:hypothetical protein